MKILLVDDNPQIRRALKALLAADATELVECADGAEALAAYLAHQPEAVVMDLAMPGMDGLTATRQIIASAPTALILILTGYDDADLRQAATAAGARGYVLKENMLEVRQWIQRINETENTD